MQLVARRQGDADPCRKLRSASSFSSDGGACTRYMQGRCSRSSSSAAATLARTMNSSISRWLSRRGRGRTSRDLAVGVEHHLALRQVEVERAARLPRRQQRAERGIKRRDGRPSPRRRRGPPAPARRSAGPRCASGRGRSGATSCGPSASIRISHEQAAAVLVGPQAAPAVGQRLRQHRHDPVGEVARYCRGSRRRGRAARRAARNAPRRRWRRSGGSRRFRSGSAQTASSKSRASSPSMVTRARSRRSSRLPSGDAAGAPACGERLGANSVRDVVGVDADQADGAGVAHACPAAR